ncbi:putative AMP-ligase [Streptomyces ambofaciens ATCC 23877]|uniref:Putative AMP-ligase n=1 Tax=Streptomyces ambofaciens (strain ATCC 23877 / 3486 / DSM 40053 / JCM 4204 / NBRC 12836 / NRRL B-2516) TaxID=278992 RepID=A0ABX9_STRA7|nr:AMP-binding protein [Streptomyces ambofaciens]AKZ60391.1 putative AMP-ligase [Streptomyces ambofaciens ATCC 23877]CAJ87982.1 putative AMP-ligase [Streptomyces ambofaciens ATCC 23877]
MTTTAADFAGRLAERPDAVALVESRKGISRTTRRGELVRHCRRIAQDLREAGVRPGHKAVVMTRDAHDLTAVSYALVMLGAVPVLIEPRAEVGRCLQDIAPDVFIGEPLAHLGRRVLGWGRPHVRTALVTGSAPLSPGRRLVTRTPADDASPPQVREPDGDEPALIAFTSGSTGRPKGAEYRHSTLAGQLDALATLMDPRSEDVLLAGFLPVALLGPLLGLATVAPAVNHLAPARTSPQEVVGPLREHRASIVLASPAVLALIARHCARHDLTLPSVRQILSFGAPLRVGLADALRKAVPDDAEILSVYGATECLPVSAIGDHDLRASRTAPPAGHAGTCLGRPLPGIRARILEADATGLGEIAVTGPTVSPTYHARPVADTFTKSDTDHGVLHRTGDLGRLDDEDRLWFLGRKAHLITGTGFTLTTEDVEAAADTAPGIRRTALVGVGTAVCQLPVLCVEPMPSTPRARALEAVRAVLKDHPDGYRVGAVLIHTAFPTDPRHNSKIDRMRLAGWAAKRLRGRVR